MKRAILLFLLVATASAEEATLNWVVFSEPIYPQMARIAHIQGQVKLELTFKPDGSVDIQAVSGHPILVASAKDSVGRSTVTCDGCKGDAHTFTVTYEFKISDPPPPPVPVPYVSPVNSRLLHHVRSIRCVYLWKCAAR